MATVRKTFTFDSEQDATLLTWLEGQPNASETARAALWAALRGAGDALPTAATLADVVKAIEGLGAQLAGLQAPAWSGAVNPAQEDPELAAALDMLGV